MLSFVSLNCLNNFKVKCIGVLFNFSLMVGLYLLVRGLQLFCVLSGSPFPINLSFPVVFLLFLSQILAEPSSSSCQQSTLAMICRSLSPILSSSPTIMLTSSSSLFAYLISSFFKATPPSVMAPDFY